MESKMSIGRRIADALAMFVVAAMSLTLLIYVAFGEARRNFENFQVERLVSQGQVLQSALESFVRPGLPIQQFAGFGMITEPMVASDDLVVGIAAYDSSGEAIFLAGDKSIPLLPSDHSKRADETHEVRNSPNLLQVVLPLKNRFETVGSIVLTSPRAMIAGQVEEAFRPLVGIALGASLAFAIFVLAFAQGTSTSKRTRGITIAFTLSFGTVAFFVISTLVSVYSQGAQARAKSIADSLGQRLEDVVTYNLNFDDFVGVIALFGEYKRLSPEIRAGALIIDGRIRAHTDPALRGARWERDESDLEYTIVLSPADAVRDVRVTVALPRAVVYKQVTRSVKNFLALFAASALFAALFMGVARSLQYIANTHQRLDSEEKENATLNLVKPVFFLAVFVEHLNYAFLPQMMQEQALAAGLSASFASAPFMAYYLCFALSLIPAGRLDSRFGSASLIVGGMIMAAAGILLLSAASSFEASVVARALAGLGQGTLFIGVQSYTLANSSPGRRTRSGAAIVFGFQAGMIAGMAIGSLLVSYIGPNGVFQLGGMIALVVVLYAASVLPQDKVHVHTAVQSSAAWKDVLTMLRDTTFLKTMLLIGVPAKAVLTGVILFALPLLLNQHGFAKEDIGQITMLYAAAVILASTVVANYADRKGATERILFAGGVITALGLAVVSIGGGTWFVVWDANSFISTALILGGVTIIGIAHGLVNAPVVTHVAETQLAATLGTANVTATYRLVERLGHTLGPVIMAQIFLFTNQGWIALGFVAIGVLLLACFFPSPQRPVDQPNSNPAMA